MANTEIKTKLLLRNDTAANWASVNPVLSKGEIGIEIDTYKLKIGDGVSSWSSLDYFGGEQLDVDGTTITLNDGKLTLNGIESAGSGYTLVSDGKGGITWAKPSETTIEGVSASVTALNERLTTTEEHVTNNLTRIETLEGDLNSKADVDAVNIISTRVDNIESAYIKSISYESGSGVFTIVKEDGSSTILDLAIEKVVANFVYDEESKSLILTLADGTTQVVPMTAFIDDYRGSEGSEVTVSISNDNVISAVLSNSIKADINKGIQALEAAESLSSTVDTVNTNITNIQKDITSINNKINNHSTVIERLEGKVSDVKDADGRSLKNAETNEVTLPIATALSSGLVKSSSEENSIEVNTSGKMHVHTLNVNKLVQTDGDELILNGGSARKAS